MGAGNSAMPPPDGYMTKKMEFANIKPKELGRFWKAFRKMDKNLSGTIQLEDFYKTVEQKRSIIGDSIFELSDCNQSGVIDFSEFFCASVTFCLLEKEELLRFCFYIFDREKNGYIDQDELKMMINILYGLAPSDKLKGNTKVALQNLDFNTDGKVDFKEFKDFHKEFPALFYPAFRIQVQMRINFCGERFWHKKSRALQDKRDRIRAREEYTRRKELKRVRKLQYRKIRKKMGCMRYLCCPGERVHYEDLFPIETKEKTVAELKKEEEEKKRKQKEEARLQAELAIKNPETEEWKLYLKRKEGRVQIRPRPTQKPLQKEEGAPNVEITSSQVPETASYRPIRNRKRSEEREVRKANRRRQKKK